MERGQKEEKTALVTGGAGFVGSHLCEQLLREGYRVISLDNYFTGSRENHVAGVEYREGHTKDIEEHVPETPDIIYHLGEYSRVEQSILDPELVHDLNTVGTASVVAFWRQRRCKLVYAGSSTKFGDGGRARFATPYARTKAENTEFVKRVGEGESLPYAITYFYNVYGPGERGGLYGTVIEAFKQMYLAGVPLTVVAPGTQRRHFTHVLDIVDGLVRVGESGIGDEYGLGNEESFTILEVAELFGGDVLMLPARSGNRMESALDTKRVRLLGWQPRETLSRYIREFISRHPRGKAHERRILVLSTTFYPIVGPAERALLTLMEYMPSLQFDIVTTVFSKEAKQQSLPVQNARIYRVGFGSVLDKYLLPILGAARAYRLHKQHTYLFAWSLMASYAAMGAMILKQIIKLPVLITLADQNIENISSPVRFLLRVILGEADQVYGINLLQERRALELSPKELRRSIGEGDAFANQLRYAYAEILLSQQKVP